MLIAVLGLAGGSEAQTLGRPGWVGSGMTANVWWRHAFVYAIDLRDLKWKNGLKGVTARMDAVQQLGADAVLLRGLQSGAGAQIGAAGIDAAAGTMDDFDEVQQQASRHNVRVLVELSPKPGEDVTGIARFWLSRGVAGFRLISTAGESGAQMREVRAAAKGFVGERVVIGDAPLRSVAVDVAAASASGRHRAGAVSSGLAGFGGKGGDGPQLLVDASIAVAPLDVAAIRMALERNDAMSRMGAGGGVPMLATADGAGAQTEGGPESGKVVATLLLSSRGGTMVRAGQEGAGPDGAGEDAEGQSLAAWYRQSSALVHGNATVRTGAQTMLNHDAEGVAAWVRRPQVVSYRSPAVVFLCNMTAKAVTVSLAADMQGLKLKGSFLKTLLRTDAGMGAMGLGAVKLAPYGVYVGELSY